MKPLTLTPRQLEAAAHAWECGGCLMLGSWAARNKLSYQYGALVRLVREYTHDNTDYSQSAEQEAA